MLGVGDYLSLNHVAHKEDHHAGVHLVLLAPSVPAGRRLSDEAPHIIRAQDGQDKAELDEHAQLGQVEAEVRRIVVAAVDGDLRILFGHDRRVLFKRLSVAARMAEE